jgi:hypothetical protein
MQRGQSTAPKRWAAWTIAIVIGVAAAVMSLDVVRRSGAMRAAMAPVGPVLAAPPGSSVKAVMRLEGPTGENAYSATLLQSDDGADYRSTPAHIRVALSAGTNLVMGAAADIKPGAVVQVTGTMDAGHALRASKIVILTGFVHLIPAQH